MILSAFNHLFENASKVKVDTNSLTEQNRRFYEQIMKFEFKKETEFMNSVYTSTTQKLTFCHNDISAANILLTIDENENAGKNLTVIDYENCFFNYRGIDIGKFFAESMHENNKEHSVYPGDEEIECLVREYLKELQRISQQFNEKIDNEDTLTLEVHCGRLLTHIFTSLWNIVHPNFSDEKFKVFENTVLRMSMYKQLKEKFLIKYPQFNNC
ncbi:choline/ethanolamine kinase-like protein [Leptotrombidium deliense]|uniref:Choline/ethanolamine kinase-like protein n=1 Tax=Leptotrombidium deliense TaxID=299467 RepID=A0A443SGE6_9ACAR|nr:choline/ethanolamine kinase-like protein [Leptotrombidium deliense]